MSKPKKPRAVNFSVIPQKDDAHEPEPYRIMREVRRKWHNDIAEAKIAMAWRRNLKPNVDGQLVLGKCVKTSDLQKEFAEWDFIILLNKEVWDDPDFTPEKKAALVDHELCHATISLDKDLERRVDARGRYIWRIRRHDVEEFESVVQHHGCYKRDLERFAEALLKKRHAPPLLAAMEKTAEVINSGALDTKGVKVTAEVSH